MFKELDNSHQEIPDHSELIRHSEQIRKELLPLYQKAAKLAHGQCPILADEGQKYKSEYGVIIQVDSGYVGVEIGFSKPEMFSDFWNKLSELQAEQPKTKI